MAAIVMIAAPVKNFLQERTDRLFYGERYDMRHSLLDFGRTLSATTAFDPLLDLSYQSFAGSNECWTCSDFRRRRFITLGLSSLLALLALIRS